MSLNSFLTKGKDNGKGLLQGIIFWCKKIFVLVEDHSGPCCLALLMIVLTIQVGGRALGFGAHLTWTDETARFLFVWSIFLSLPLASKHGALVHIKLSEKIWPAKLRPAIHKIASLSWCLTALLLALLCLSNIYTLREYPQLTPILGFNQNYLQLVMPLAFLMVFIRTFSDLFRAKKL